MVLELSLLDVDVHSSCVRAAWMMQELASFFEVWPRPTRSSFVQLILTKSLFQRAKARKFLSATEQRLEDLSPNT